MKNEKLINIKGKLLGTSEHWTNKFLWVLTECETSSEDLCDGMIFSAQQGQCVDELVSVAHPGKNSIWPE